MKTPQTPVPELSAVLAFDQEIWLKREDLHRHGSHKGRSIPIMIDEAARTGSRRFVISSSGNAAREKGSNFTITDEEVKKQVSEKYPSSVFVKDKQEALDYLLKNLKPTDVVVVMAVGSFNRLGYELLEKLQNK
jgi:hypothetical protein